ncbi:MAG: 2-polyprenyl-3-methyl-6-methoxy-1,4-benzoquinone monooxygenase [Woeseiaceae bacterium]
MQERQLTALDRLLAGIDGALKSFTAGQPRPARSSPARDVPENYLSRSEVSLSAALMRVNHSGEIAAQGLYQGHALFARDLQIRRRLREAAQEERDHLGWCEERLTQLDAGPSRLSPLWYAGAFAIGAASGVLGDKWSLGFIEETERQVAEHLSGHLERLPPNDARSRAIVERMRSEEERHGADARQAGAAALPEAIRELMRVTARVMTRTAFRV